MREILSARFVAAIAALVGLGGIVWLALPDHSNSLVPVSSGLTERRIDFLSLVFQTTAQEGWGVEDGVTTKQMELIIDSRRMRIPPGTPADVTCPNMNLYAQCAVAADMLGDAVVWFALVPALPRKTLQLPALVELRKNNEVLLANGWVLKRSSVIDRQCSTETESLQDFFDKFGNRASSVFNFDKQQVVRVVCRGEAAVDDTVPEETVPVGTEPVDGSIPDDTIPNDSVVDIPAVFDTGPASTATVDTSPEGVG